MIQKKMNKSLKKISIFLLILSLLHSNQTLSKANDTLNRTKVFITNQETLVSSDGAFELGFFSPDNSKNWYVGIWYKKITTKTVVWVANREIPVRNCSSGMFKLVETGLLVVMNETNDIIWSSNASTIAKDPIVQLLDSGNLVIRNENDDNYVWQSFDYPSDTFLGGMNFGWNYVTGAELYLSAWKSNEDPSPGEFTFHLEPCRYPRAMIKRRGVTIYRMGPWNGVAFSGTPDVRNDPQVTFTLYSNNNGVYYRGDAIDKSVISRFTLNPNGVGQRWTWVDQAQDWVLYFSNPADNCDTYNLCGSYGSCNVGKYPICVCLDKFVPKDPDQWTRLDWSKGCVRKTTLNCSIGHRFMKFSNLKLPDARTLWYNVSMNLEECREECLKNCSCMAYTDLDISRGGSGCLLWFGELLDIRVMSTNGQDVYIRVDSSEFESNGKRKQMLVLSLTMVGMALLGLSMYIYAWKMKKNDTKGRKHGSYTKTNSEDLDLPVFDLSTISKATNSFSIENKLGEGGYGPVYKGTLEEGQDVAVKRLSMTSTQGHDEFMNEVTCIAKLQHRNLVKLLGCCIQGEEKMLIYEYMPNKSLDLVLFDQKTKTLLDWPKRLHVVNGIARGLMYLHHDSRLRIVHRDLKASNILLDSEMNPKISDFGIAKRFRGNETEDKTGRVVGTYGYMSPEYAAHGRFSIKSDVFSFGVLVLEIVSGKRNNTFSNGEHNLNLLGHAWTLYKTGRPIQFVDDYLQNLDDSGQVLRLTHVGLLCVQQRAADRPSMTSVVAMLSNDFVLPQANHPGFFMETGSHVPERLISNPSCTNEVTITLLNGR